MKWDECEPTQAEREAGQALVTRCARAIESALTPLDDVAQREPWRVVVVVAHPGSELYASVRAINDAIGGPMGPGGEIVFALSVDDAEAALADMLGLVPPERFRGRVDGPRLVALVPGRRTMWRKLVRRTVN
jgi:hypothetical protein